MLCPPLYLYLRDELKEKLDTELNEKEDSLTDEEIEKIFSSVVKEELEYTKESPLLDQLSEDFTEIIKNNYLDVITSIREQVFGSIPGVETSTDLIDLTLEIISRQRFGNTYSGVVIAGFGEKEHFPSVVELYIDGMIENQVLFCKNRQIMVGDDELNACVIPFAQREMVSTFMEGIDPSFKSMIEQSTVELFLGVSGIILDEVKEKYAEFDEKLEQKIFDTLKDLLRNLLKRWDENREQHYSGPVMEIVAALPKDELAAMAESLVNLTKFKRRVSKQHETVGGPIDVAVITKGDGFVWIKRKHYFNAELNPRFMSKYYKRGEQ